MRDRGPCLLLLSLLLLLLLILLFNRMSVQECHLSFLLVFIYFSSNRFSLWRNLHIPHQYLSPIFYVSLSCLSPSNCIFLSPHSYTSIFPLFSLTLPYIQLSLLRLANLLFLSPIPIAMLLPSFIFSFPYPYLYILPLLISLSRSHFYFSLSSPLFMSFIFLLPTFLPHPLAVSG